MTKHKRAILAAMATAALWSQPISAQDSDDDDELSGGALAVLLLAVGGSAATDADLRPGLKAVLDEKKVAYSDKQLKSLSSEAAKKLAALRGGAGQFTVCATEGRPCVRIVRK